MVLFKDRVKFLQAGNNNSNKVLSQKSKTWHFVEMKQSSQKLEIIQVLGSRLC